MATYYCSDPHAFHGNILKYCRQIAFMTDTEREASLALEADGGNLSSLRISAESVDRMNRGLAANMNARVAPNDTLWCLGDWAFGRGAEYLWNARWFRDQIQCRNIHLIWGNHDDKAIRDPCTRVCPRPARCAMPPPGRRSTWGPGAWLPGLVAGGDPGGAAAAAGSLQALKRDRRLFDPFRGREQRTGTA